MAGASASPDTLVKRIVFRVFFLKEKRIKIISVPVYGTVWYGREENFIKNYKPFCVSPSVMQ